MTSSLLVGDKLSLVTSSYSGASASTSSSIAITFSTLNTFYISFL